MKPFVLIQGDRILLTVDGKTVTVDRSSNSAFDDVVAAINEGDYDKALELSNPARAIEEFYANDSAGTLTIRGNSVTFNDTRLAPALEDRLLEMHRARLPLTPLANFLARVAANPSSTSRRELYLFLEGNQLPLTPDGFFMAYKSVDHWSPDMTYYDKEAGEHRPLTLDDGDRPFEEGDFRSLATSEENNRPTRLRVGDVVEMDRGSVDDRRSRTCSFGYHFASLQYASTWSRHDALLLMKIDPADVVSIPSDYGNQKGRTCRYEVTGVHYDNGRSESHGDEVEDVLSESPVYQASASASDRYEVRDDVTDAVVGSFATRSAALEEMRYRNGIGMSLHVWDTVAQRRWRS